MQLAIGDRLGITTTNDDTLIGEVIYYNRRTIVLGPGAHIANPAGGVPLSGYVEVIRRNVAWVQRLPAATSESSED